MASRAATYSLPLFNSMQSSLPSGSNVIKIRRNTKDVVDKLENFAEKSSGENQSTVSELTKGRADDVCSTADMKGEENVIITQFYVLSGI